MSQFDFATYKSFVKTNGVSETEQPTYRPRIRNFFLKDDKDQAIVRFMVDNTNNISIVGLHRYWIDGRLRAVSCLRNPTENLMVCPFCKDGAVNVQYRAFIPMLVYTTGDKGEITAVPMVWERPTTYIDTLNSKISEYGPLKDCLYKITRHGVSGARNTEYTTDICLPSVYPVETYPILEDAFDGYTPVGTSVYSITDDEEIKEIIDGRFPARFTQRQQGGFTNTNTQSTSTVQSKPVKQTESDSVSEQADVEKEETAPSYSQSQSQPSYRAPRLVEETNQSTQPQATRPRRYY